MRWCYSDGMATWVIGDIHGCSDELEQLLGQIPLEPGDSLLSVGDLFHRGPDPVGVMNLLQEAQVRFLAIMRGEAERMSHLIQDLLSLSRVEVNEHIAPTIAAAVDAILKSLKEMLAPRAAERNMIIELDVSKDLPIAMGDPDQLHQVFRNLVDNAISYGKEGTPIRVGVQRIERMPRIGGPGVAVSVRDEGDGIPDEQIFRLTERFYRVDKGRSRSMGGTGLGLAIVKHIVSRHRGALAVESQVGKGSTFTVTIPAQPD